MHNRTKPIVFRTPSFLIQRSSASTQCTHVPRNSVMLTKVTFHLSLMFCIYSFSLKSNLTVTDMVHGTRVQRAACVPLGIVDRNVTRLVPRQRWSQQPPRNQQPRQVYVLFITAPCDSRQYFRYVYMMKDANV